MKTEKGGREAGKGGADDSEVKGEKLSQLKENLEPVGDRWMAGVGQYRQRVLFLKKLGWRK